MITDYDYTISVDTTFKTCNGFGNCSDFGNCTCWPKVTYYPYISTTPERIYLYQVECPNCKTKNFLELEVITPCKKCKKTLKATEKLVDYEISIDA